MFTAVIVVLLFLGMRAIFRYRVAKSLDYADARNTCLWSLIPACFMLIEECLIFAFPESLGGFDYSIMAEAFLLLGSLPAVVILWGAVRLPKDGWVLRGVLLAVILLGPALIGIGMYRDASDFSSEEQERYQRNLIRCADLIDLGKRKPLADALAGLQTVPGSSFHDFNDCFDAALKKVEVAK